VVVLFESVVLMVLMRDGRSSRSYIYYILGFSPID
jgi:hypothetical protein